MNIKLIKSERTSLYTVEVTYKLDDSEFTVEWSNVDAETGKIVSFYLNADVKSNNKDLEQKVSDTINEGAKGSNVDLELYLFVRDTFDNSDCMYADTDISGLAVTDTQLHLFVDDKGQRYEGGEIELEYSISYAINDAFMIQYAPVTGFTIPDAAEASWNNDTIQDVACNTVNANELARILNLPKSLKDLNDQYVPEIEGSSEAQRMLEEL